MADISRTFKSPPKARKATTAASSFTVKPSQSGQTFFLNGAASVVATLPLIRKENDGVEYTFIVGSLPSGNGHEVRNQSTDAIQWDDAAGTTITTAEALRCAVAGDRIGDNVTLQAVYGLGWVVKAISGTWTKVA